jgi:hypothetical protein
VGGCSCCSLLPPFFGCGARAKDARDAFTRYDHEEQNSPTANTEFNHTSRSLSLRAQVLRLAPGNDYASGGQRIVELIVAANLCCIPRPHCRY